MMYIALDRSTAALYAASDVETADFYTAFNRVTSALAGSTTDPYATTYVSTVAPFVVPGRIWKIIFSIQLCDISQ